MDNLPAFFRKVLSQSRLNFRGLVVSGMQERHLRLSTVTMVKAKLAFIEGSSQQG